MIQKVPSYVDYNYWLKRLDTQYNESTNHKFLKVPEVVNQTNKKMLFKTLVTNVINSPLFPSFLVWASDLLSFASMVAVIYEITLYIFHRIPRIPNENAPTIK